MISKLNSDRNWPQVDSLFKAGAIATAMMVPAAVMAAENYSIAINTNGVQTSNSANSLNEFIDLGLSSNGFSTLNPAYTDTSVATVNLRLRGLPMTVTYPTSGPALVYTVPALGFTRTFDAQGTREGNEEDLVEFLQTNQDGLLSEFLNYFVSETGTDPVAGNPASLQSSMIAADFGVGTGLGADNSSQAGDGTADGEGRRNVYGLAARLGRFSVDGNDITTFDLPFSIVRPLEDPRYALIFDLPLTYVDTNGSETFAASLGLGMRIPITTRWTLTPMVRAGATGSIDLGSLATLYSGSLSSSYKFDVGSTEVNIGNLLSYISTTDVTNTVADFEIDYDLQNTVTRNGVGLSGPLAVKLFGADTTWQGSLVNTQIFGDDVYINNYTDLAVSIGTQQSRNGLTWDSIRIGFTYTVGNNGFQGGRLNFGYQF